MARITTAGILSAAVLSGGIWAHRHATASAPPPLPTNSSEAFDYLRSVRFIAVDVFVDSGTIPLAAYQFEFSAPGGGASIVDIEGGESAAFTSPPYYDPEALMQGRIIVGAFNTGDELPSGKTRVARMHLRVEGEPVAEFSVQLTVAGNVNGDQIDASASVARAVSES
ncbi:MAG TPA: hypothetical protein VNT79_01430 [Phycisphaerae bacterium]|nr:hypothetical protein [Phycisphaerae bacterium]